MIDTCCRGERALQSKQKSVSAPVSVYLAVAVAVVSASSAAILIRLALAESMSPIFITSARLSIAALLLTPLALKRHWGDIQGLGGRELLLAAASGAFLALHFVAWVSALQYTTVLVSVVIVSSGPIWVAILEVIFLRVHLSRLVIVGLLIALAGGIFIGLPSAGPDLLANADGQTTLTGAFLSWIGALAISVYLLIGRKLRAKLPVIPYIWLVYGIAALVMLALALGTATPIWGFRLEGYFILLVMGLAPQLLGHSSMNYILAYFPATLVSMFSQLEPIGSAALALIFFRELPPAQQIIGSCGIIAGVFLASRGSIRPSD